MSSSSPIHFKRIKILPNVSIRSSSPSRSSKIALAQNSLIPIEKDPSKQSSTTVISRQRTIHWPGYTQNHSEQIISLHNGSPRSPGEKRSPPIQFRSQIRLPELLGTVLASRNSQQNSVTPEYQVSDLEKSIQSENSLLKAENQQQEKLKPSQLRSELQRSKETHTKILLMVHHMHEERALLDVQENTGQQHQFSAIDSSCLLQLHNNIVALLEVMRKERSIFQEGLDYITRAYQRLSFCSNNTLLDSLSEVVGETLRPQTCAQLVQRLAESIDDFQKRVIRREKEREQNALMKQKIEEEYQTEQRKMSLDDYGQRILREELRKLEEVKNGELKKQQSEFQNENARLCSYVGVLQQEIDFLKQDLELQKNRIIGEYQAISADSAQQKINLHEQLIKAQNELLFYKQKSDEYKDFHIKGLHALKIASQRINTLELKVKEQQEKVLENNKYQNIQFADLTPRPNFDKFLPLLHRDGSTEDREEEEEEVLQFTSSNTREKLEIIYNLIQGKNQQLSDHEKSDSCEQSITE